MPVFLCAFGPKTRHVISPNFGHNSSSMMLSRARLPVLIVRQQQVRHSSGPFWGQCGFDNYRKNLVHGSQAAGKAAGFWYKVCLFGVIPAVGLATINGYMGHQKEHNEPRPEFVPYQHMRIRTKEYPWGGYRSLFHNPHTNALPDGYEEEGHH